MRSGWTLFWYSTDSWAIGVWQNGGVKPSPWVWILAGLGALAALVSGGAIADAIFGAFVIGGLALLIDWVIQKNRSGRESASSGKSPPRPQPPSRPSRETLASEMSRPSVAKGDLVLDCSECGKEVTEEAKFCPHCGSHFEDPSCPNPNCDVIPSEDNLFCSECGWDLKAET